MTVREITLRVSGTGLIEVSVSAEPAHRAHGDAKVGEAVPGNAGRVFTASCGLQ